MESYFLEGTVLTALLVGTRLSGLMVFAPFLGSSSLPREVKVGLTLAMTAVFVPVYGLARTSIGLTGCIGMMTRELMIGSLLGLSLNFIFDAVQFAGQLAGLQMGFSLVNLIDPQTQVDTPVLSILHQLLALLIFLRLDVHHWLIRAVGSSFVYLPLGGQWLRGGIPDALLHAAAGLWSLGLQIAAPVLVATMLTDLALGFLTKASPHLPAMFLGLSLKSLLGFTVLAASLGFWPSLLARHFSAALRLSDTLLAVNR